MRFSILIPVYNTAKYLPECLVSVLSQTYTDFEAIIVDDGSTDESGQMLDAYSAANPEILKVIHKENGGLISARRAAINAAKGEYCVFLDSDDFLERNALEEIAKHLEKTGSDIVIYRIRKCYPGNPLDLPTEYEDGRIFEGEEKREIYSVFISRNGLNSLCMKAIRTSLLLNDPTDYSGERNPRGEDKFQSLYPITEAKRISYLDRLLYNCRVNDESITRQVGIANAHGLINKNAVALLRQMMTRWGMDDPEHLEAFYVWQLIELIDYFSSSFSAAQSEKERREIFGYDWFSLITPGFEPYIRSRLLTKSKSMRLEWLYKGRYFLMKTAYAIAGARR